MRFTHLALHRFKPGTTLLAAGRVAVTLTALGAVGAGVLAVQTPAAPGASRTEAADLVIAAPSIAPSATPSITPSLTPTATPTPAATTPSPDPAAVAAQVARDRAAAASRAARSAQRDPRSTARLMLADHGWSSGQFSCLDSLWTRESGWNYRARNASSGAFGIAQALPGAKMSSAGADWATNPITQITWGLQYIHDVYGSPCGAWAHSQAVNWY